MLERITPYIHVYEFPYHDHLLYHFNNICKYYDENIENNFNIRGRVNVVFPNNSIDKFLRNKLNNIVTQNYYVTPPINTIGIGIYKQTNQQNFSISHHHKSNTNDITGVFYINPPKVGEGGELEFYNKVYESNTIKIQPEPNKLYLFPSWLYHRPLPQTIEKPRLSLNWGYTSGIVPIHKITADRW